MSEENTQPALDVAEYIKVARDSVWEVNDAIQRLTEGAEPDNNIKGRIDRNVGHLKLVVANQELIDSGQDISDLNLAITAGEAKLAENIWPA